MAAIFKGRIIEAYYTDPENSTVEVIYMDGKRAINHYIAADMAHPDFQDLVQEYGLEKIEESTIAKNKAALGQLSRVVDIKVKQEIDAMPLESFQHVMDFVVNYDVKKHADNLFNLKLQIFETKVVKQHDDVDAKNKIRQATTPLDALIAYAEIVKQSK